MSSVFMSDTTLSETWMCQFSKHDQTTWQTKIPIRGRHGPSLKAWMYIQLEIMNWLIGVLSILTPQPFKTHLFTNPKSPHGMLEGQSRAISASWIPFPRSGWPGCSSGCHSWWCWLPSSYRKLNRTSQLPCHNRSIPSLRTLPHSKVKRNRISCYFEAPGYMHCIC